MSLLDEKCKSGPNISNPHCVHMKMMAPKSNHGRFSPDEGLTNMRPGKVCCYCGEESLE